MAVITDNPNEAQRQALDAIRSHHKRLKNVWLANRDTFLAPVAASKALEVFMFLHEHITAVEAAIQTPGLVEYARAFYGDQTYDVAAEVTAALAAAREVRAWMVASWNGLSFRYVTLAEDGSRTIHTFPAGQLSGLVSRMDALVALID